MEKLVGKFTFKVPDGHAEAGKQIEKAFDYEKCETEQEAQEVITAKGWKLANLVNDVLKANARSNAYQAALLPYRPSEVSEEDIAERMVRDYIRLGFSEEVARETVTKMLAARPTAQ